VAATQGKEASMASKKRPRVLVVDDDAGITSTFKAILGCEGYEVATANHGVEALELVRREPFDLILLDLLLPHMDGWTVLKHVREISPTTRVVILCADVDPEGEVEAFRLGAVDVLLKPPDVHKLLRFVNELTRPSDDEQT
jgi:DNA-binding response OmpR family regulator